MDTIRGAFDQHREFYAEGNPEWSISHHVGMWHTAQKAFDGPSFPDFEKLYNILKNHWQVFRGGVESWPENKLFDALGACDKSLCSRKLSSISDEDVPAIWALLQSIKDLKVNKHRPSVVAVSKFLHFWNPRLFVIVDDQVIWKWVLAHKWLRDGVNSVRSQTDQQIFGKDLKHNDGACDLSTYLAILVWAGNVLRANPAIVPEFERCVRATIEEQTISLDLFDYEAPAIEWFLLGVVELPPRGVSDWKSAP